MGNLLNKSNNEVNENTNIDTELKLNQSKEKFNDNGYVLLKNYLTEEESQKIVQFADELEKWDEEAYKWMIFFENNETIKRKTRLENFLDYHADLKQFYETKIVPLVTNIWDSDVFLFKEKLNWKYGQGKGFKAHQDQPAWTDFEPTKYVTVALFANNTTTENGCLEFATNLEQSEKYKTILENDVEGSGALTQELEDSLEWSPTETTTRDILIFDSFVPHRSHENKTDGSRRIFYFTFNESQYGDLYDAYLKKKREEFPPEIERELLDGKNWNDLKITGNKYNLANPIG